MLKRKPCLISDLGKDFYVALIIRLGFIPLFEAGVLLMVLALDGKDPWSRLTLSAMVIVCPLVGLFCVLN